MTRPPGSDVDQEPSSRRARREPAARGEDGAPREPAARGEDGTRRGSSWRAGPAVPLAFTVVAFTIGYLQKLPCYQTAWRKSPHVRFSEFCYSDMSILYRQRGLISGIFPYSPGSWEHPLEYPVITGLLTDWTGRLARALVPGGGWLAASRAYFDVNVVMLLGFALAVVWATWATLDRLGAPPAVTMTGALLVAASPSMAFAGTINWDLVAVGFAAGAVLAWARQRPVLAGVLIGLGTAAKLYPVLLLLPPLVLGLRRRLRDPGGTAKVGGTAEVGRYGGLDGFVRSAAAAVVAWGVVNAPVALLYPDGWLEFWRFNARRGADYGSIWHALAVTGNPVSGVNVLSSGLLALLLAGVAVLGLRAPRSPAPEQLALLTVAAFLVTNKVYSPQYVLWLLPLVVLALSVPSAARGRGTVLAVWGVWQAAEMVYWFAIWRYFTPLADGEHWQYPAAVALRIVVTLALCALVVRDCARPASRESARPASRESARPASRESARPA